MRFALIISLLGALAACQASGKKTGIRLEPVPASELPDRARLRLVTPADSLTTGSNALKFEVTGFELGAATTGPRSGEIATSAKGQHIHMIIDNAPYMARYQTDFEVSLAPGRHLMLAFLSRSYHESLKSAKAYVVKQFEAGITGSEPFDLEKNKHLFYSRPKGEYQWKAGESQPILLDFYLLNTDLRDGSYVRATINRHVFRLRSWQPYYIYGLSPGVHSISLELMNIRGQPIPGPFNHSGKRTFTIKNQ